MVTLKIRMYQGRELHYTKEGDVQNKSQLVKMSEFHFINKFLKYCKTLSSLIILEEAYDVKYVPREQSKCIPVSEKRFEEFKQKLLDVGVKKVTEDPLVGENKRLVEQAGLNEKELTAMKAEMAEIRALISPGKGVPKKTQETLDLAKAEDSDLGVVDPAADFNPLQEMTRKELIIEAKKAKVKLTGKENKTEIIKKL